MRFLAPSGTALRAFVSRATPGGEPSALEGTVAGGELESPEASYFGWEIARSATGLSATEQRQVAALAAASLWATLNGSTRLRLGGPVFASAIAASGGSGSVAEAERIAELCRTLPVGHPALAVIGRPGERKPIIVDGEWVYVERMRRLEERFCERVRVLAASPPLAPDERAIRRAVGAVAAEPLPLTREQKRAVAAALGAPLTLISGAPGTGKTLTIVALVRAALWMGVAPASIAVAAPTGKASQRLAEAIAAGLAGAEKDLVDGALRTNPPAPATLHRLLGFSPSTGRFAHGEKNPLSARLIVVDEASMIDLVLFDRLFSALAPGARLVLVGDADQLPSVQAGAVFRDLCLSLGVQRLSTNLRVSTDTAARGIVAAAEHVNAGRVPLEARALASPADVRFEGVELLGAPWSEVGGPILDAWFGLCFRDDASLAAASRAYGVREGDIDPSGAAAARALFEAHARARILTATRAAAFPASADAINASLLERLVQRTGRDRDVAAAGAPVAVRSNDYERGLYNGESGVVIEARDEGSLGGARPMLVLRRGDALETWPLDDGTAVDVAFATTVHKAQGSEFDHVLLVLPDSDHPLLSRELVYTAVTRARRSVLVVGAREVLARAVARTEQRASGVAERLAAGAKL